VKLEKATTPFLGFMDMTFEEKTFEIIEMFFKDKTVDVFLLELQFSRFFHHLTDLVKILFINIVIVSIVVVVFVVVVIVVTSKALAIDLDISIVIKRC